MCVVIPEIGHRRIASSSGAKLGVRQGVMVPGSPSSGQGFKEYGGEGIAQKTDSCYNTIKLVLKERADTLRINGLGDPPSPFGMEIKYGPQN